MSASKTMLLVTLTSVALSCTARNEPVESPRYEVGPDVVSPDVVSPDEPYVVSPDVVSPDVVSPDVVSPDEPYVVQPYDIEERVPWTTSRVQGRPDPPPPYRTRVAFAGVDFRRPISLVAIPGRAELAVAEVEGRIYTFRDDPEVRETTLLLELRRQTYSIAFHPDFERNGFLYVVSVHEQEHPKGTWLSRFAVERGEGLRVDPQTETVLLKWPAVGHRGGCIKFGPEGYLYVSIGDGSGIADERQTGQDVGDLFASILRLDVDRPSGDLPYGIPPDNPFVGQEGARGEVWAYGLRQVWKMSFDRETGELWAGEVGQDLWEMVNIIERGGNYGWSVTEGSHPFRPARPRGPSPIVEPLVEHDHYDFRSLTGGFVYRGSRREELAGTYIYGDFDTGRVWGVRAAEGKVTWNEELADTPLRVVAFGEAHDGEVYLVDYTGGQMHELVPAPAVAPRADFPRRLSETGLFASVPQHRPAPGLFPYSVNSPLWSDGASKERFLAIPGMGKIEIDAVHYPDGIEKSTPGWKFPDGTVLVKTFSLDMERGNPASRRRIETRLLHYENVYSEADVADSAGDQYWHGYSYVWNEEQTEAVLVDRAGLDLDYVIADADAPGGETRQTWRFPSRTECTLCHNMGAKYVLGVTTLQMNREHDYGEATANQLSVLERLGMFSAPLPAAPQEIPRLVDHRDTEEPLDARARAYLHSNCSHCHRLWGGGNTDFELVHRLALEDTGIVDVRPEHGDFGIEDARLLAPGDPERSLIPDRMNKLGLGRMPHVASNVVDETAVALVRKWIREMDATDEGAATSGLPARDG